MSGRVRPTLSDGRRHTKSGKRITGFRKTLRIQSVRTPPHLLPDWRLTIPLPLSFIGVNEGSHGVIGVRVEREVILGSGKDRDWLIGQAVALVRKLDRRWTGVLRGSVCRDGEAPELPKARLQPQHLEIDLGITPTETTVVYQRAMRTLRP